MLNPKITKFAEKYDITREAAGMGIYLLKDDFIKMDEHVYHLDLPINSGWRVEHLLGVLKTCERVGLFG